MRARPATRGDRDAGEHDRRRDRHGGADPAPPRATSTTPCRRAVAAQTPRCPGSRQGRRRCRRSTPCKARRATATISRACSASLQDAFSTLAGDPPTRRSRPMWSAPPAPWPARSTGSAAFTPSSARPRRTASFPAVDTLNKALGHDRPAERSDHDAQGVGAEHGRSREPAGCGLADRLLAHRPSRAEPEQRRRDRRPRAASRCPCARHAGPVLDTERDAGPNAYYPGGGVPGDHARRRRCHQADHRRDDRREHRAARYDLADRASRTRRVRAEPCGPFRRAGAAPVQRPGRRRPAPVPGRRCSPAMWGSPRRYRSTRRCRRHPRWCATAPIRWRAAPTGASAFTPNPSGGPAGFGGAHRPRAGLRAGQRGAERRPAARERDGRARPERHLSAPYAAPATLGGHGRGAGRRAGGRTAPGPRSGWRPSKACRPRYRRRSARRAA